MRVFPKRHVIKPVDGIRFIIFEANKIDTTRFTFEFNLLLLANASMAFILNVR
jgi:hypothetical protein